MGTYSGVASLLDEHDAKLRDVQLSLSRADAEGSRWFGSVMDAHAFIDLDVARMPVHTVKEKVGKILGAPALALPLRSRGVSVSEVTSPKQTETTQRWKVGLSLEGRSLALHAKIEFSRRGTTEDAVIEPVAASLLAEYRLMPLLATHYPLAAALRQKIGALAAILAVALAVCGVAFQLLEFTAPTTLSPVAVMSARRRGPRGSPHQVCGRLTLAATSFTTPAGPLSKMSLSRAVRLESAPSRTP